MTSRTVPSPTTGAHKDSELRIPAKLIVQSFTEKKARDLETFARLKLMGSRVEVKRFCKVTGIHRKTAGRLIRRLHALQWIGFDGTYIFTRSWSRIGYKKKFGLYITSTKKLATAIFTHALKTVTRREARARKRRRSAMPKGLPARYYSTALNISERSYFRKIRSAVKNGYIRVTKQRTKIGSAKEFSALRKNLHGVPLFKCGKFTVLPAPSTIEFL